MDYSAIHAKQRAYFQTGATRSREARMDALKKLRSALKEHAGALEEALRTDLNKQPMESAMCETGVVSAELRYAMRHLKGWMREKRTAAPLYDFPAHGLISPEPLGQVLIISPWNYPVQLCLVPLIGAIAAGNCAVIKPSVKAPETARALKAMLESIYPEEFVCVVEGSREETAGLLELKWDHIFFTGSQTGGRQILAAAARHLTPVTLELGGKSPVIVDSTANIKRAARRIAFGKALNAGQTCVAPDYLLIHADVKDAFIAEYQKAVKKFFPKSRYQNMVSIISDEHFLRLASYMEGAQLASGGETEPEQRRIQPTLIDAPAPDAPILREEVFGPLLPMLTWTELDWCIDYINAREKPLALYLFTGDKAVQRQVLDRCAFGGGCLNDTIVHAAGERLPFGGVGASGMGSYHGKKSFDTFTHYRSILSRGTWADPSLRYFPYGKLKALLVRLFLK